MGFLIIIKDAIIEKIININKCPYNLRYNSRKSIPPISILMRSLTIAFIGVVVTSPQSHLNMLLTVIPHIAKAVIQVTKIIIASNKGIVALWRSSPNISFWSGFNRYITKSDNLNITIVKIKATVVSGCKNESNTINIKIKKLYVEDFFEFLKKNIAMNKG